MRITRFVGIAVLAAAPALLHAQASTANPRPISIGVSGGVSLPVGDFGDAVKTGFSIAGHVWVLPPGVQALNFRGDVSYDRWNAKTIAGEALDGNAHTLGVTANALLKVPTAVGLHPYVIVGGGYYNYNVDIDGQSGDSQNKFGLQGGVGLEFALNGFGAFLEGKFVNVFNSDEGSSDLRYIPITFGIRF